MQRSIRKTGFHGTWWSRGFTSILSNGGGGKRVSTLLYFQQLVFLDDCVTFRSSRISIYFQPETSVPPFVLIHLLWMQRALRSSTCFPAISSNGLPPPPPSPRFPPPAALFIYRRICRASCGERDQENLWCTQVRRSLPTRRAEEKLRLGRSKLFEKFSKLFFFLLLFSSSIHFL